MFHVERIAALAALGVLVLCAAPAGAAVVGLECDPPSCEFEGAEILDVYITVDGDVTDLRGVSLDLLLNTSVLNADRVELSDLTLSGGCSWTLFHSTGTDSLRIDGAGLGCSVAGPGRILRIRFSGVDTGSSFIRCRTSDLRDSANQPIAHQCDEAFVSFDGSVPVEGTTWGRIKRMYE